MNRRKNVWRGALVEDPARHMPPGEAEQLVAMGLYRPVVAEDC